MIQDNAHRIGFESHGIIDITYSGGLPLHLHVFARPNNPIPAGYQEGVAGTTGYTGVKAAFEPIAKLVKASNPRAIALDPCCGMGYTAQASIDFGLSFRGNELNEKRLGKTIARLEKAVG